MNNKYRKWLVVVFSFSFIIYILMLLIYIIVDPEIVFNHSITKAKYGYTDYYSKYQFEKLKTSNYSLVFGTSRSQKISSRAQNIPLLNFHNLYGEPKGILNFLTHLNKKQIKNVDHVYYLVSILTMTNDKPNLNYKKNTFYDKLKFIFPLSNLSVKFTIRDILYNIKGNVPYHIDCDGSLYLENKEQTTILNKIIDMPSEVNRIKTNNSIKLLTEIDKFCKKNNIKITYYVPTNSDRVVINYETIKYLWSTLFDNGIDGFYNTYYIEGVSDNKDGIKYFNFKDEVHLNYNSMNKVFKDNVLEKNSSRFIDNKGKLNNMLINIKEKFKNAE